MERLAVRAVRPLLRLCLATTVVLAAPLTGAAAETVSTLYSFSGGADGSLQTGSVPPNLTTGPGGALYGVSSSAIYKFGQDAKGHWLVTPVFPLNGLSVTGLAGAPTALYGLTSGFCQNVELGRCGAVVTFLPPAKGKTQWTEATVYTFKGGKDGAAPSGITLAPDGSIYGTTLSGGGSFACGQNGPNPDGCGTVFRIAKVAGKWQETVIHALHGSDGAQPFAAPALDGAGNVYVATYQSFGSAAATVPPPSSGGGAPVIKVQPGDVVEPNRPAVILWSQPPLQYVNSVPMPRNDIASLRGTPAAPAAATSVIVASAGGGNAADCAADGDNGCGLIALLTEPASGKTPWTLKVLHEFNGSDGALPGGALTSYGPDTIYGTAGIYNLKLCTAYSDNACGVIYKLARGRAGWAWGGVVYRFKGGVGGSAGTDLVPYKGLLVGTTTDGGKPSPACPQGCGTIFALKP